MNVAVVAEKTKCITTTTISNAVLSKSASKEFVKTLTPSVISYIIHQRTKFNRNDFNTLNKDGIEYKVLKKNPRNACFRDLCKWIAGAMDAFDKNYLRELNLFFLDQENEEILERYRLQFKYMGEDAIEFPEEKASEQELTAATEDMFQQIKDLDSYEVHENAILKMSLKYYEDVTPEGYVPPNFKSTKYEDEQEKPKHNVIVRLGTINTGFHIVKATARGKQFSEHFDKTGSTENLDLDQEEEQLDSTVNKSMRSVQDNSNPENSLSTVLSSSSLMNRTVESDIFTLNTVNCFCKFKLTFKEVALVRCMKCRSNFHNVCVNFLYDKDVPKSFLCDMCHDGKKLKLGAYMMRFIIAYMFHNKKLPIDIIRTLNSKNQADIWGVLKDLRVTKQVGKEREIDVEAVTKLIPEVFRPNDKKSTETKDSKRRKLN